jgi:SAM-dependent methyltransferase
MNRRAIDGCIVCSGTVQLTRLDYRSCESCGHEILDSTAGQSFILNERLELAGLDRPNLLDRFKLRRLREWRGADAEILADFGCASGRFLYQCRQEFGTVLGVEVTPQALEFARGRLGLDVRESADELPRGLSVVTCWHSLEHLPPDVLRPTVAALAERLRGGGRLIVSVPNADSWQYRCLGRDYAYYDVPNHPHQFTPRSLDRLMQQAGLCRIRLAFSGVYNAFGWLQGLLNRLGGGHNVLYYRLKRGTAPVSRWSTGLHLALLPFVALPALPLTLLDAARAERQGVITACYEKC